MTIKARGGLWRHNRGLGMGSDGWICGIQNLHNDLVMANALLLETVRAYAVLQAAFELYLDAAEVKLDGI